MLFHRDHWNAMKWSRRPVQGLCSWWFAGTRLPKFGHTSQKRGWIRGALRFAWCMRWEMMFGALMFLGTAFKQIWPVYNFWCLLIRHEYNRWFYFCTWMFVCGWFLDDALSRVESIEAAVWPWTGGSAWTGASRPIGPWFCQGPHTGCQLCRASGSWCLCQWRAVWLIPGNCSQMQLAIQFEFQVIILVQFDRFQNFKLLWLCPCDRCKTKPWKTQELR